MKNEIWSCKDAMKAYGITQQKWLGIMRKHGVGAYWNHDFTRLHFNSADFADAMAKEKEKASREPLLFG